MVLCHKILARGIIRKKFILHSIFDTFRDHERILFCDLCRAMVVMVLHSVATGFPLPCSHLYFQALCISKASGLWEGCQ